MCRNIKMLFNFDPPVTAEEIRAASLQYVRKVSGFNKPSKANEAAFLQAVDQVANISARLLDSLETNAPARNREEEAAKQGRAAYPILSPAANKREFAGSVGRGFIPGNTATFQDRGFNP
jgi:hypothetical protein